MGSRKAARPPLWGLGDIRTVSSCLSLTPYESASLISSAGLSHMREPVLAQDPSLHHHPANLRGRGDFPPPPGRGCQGMGPEWLRRATQDQLPGQALFSDCSAWAGALSQGSVGPLPDTTVGGHQSGGTVPWERVLRSQTVGSKKTVNTHERGPPLQKD